MSTSATGPNVGPHTRRPQARDAAKILADCRDLAIHRLVLSFSSLLDRVGDMLMERANRSTGPRGNRPLPRRAARLATNAAEIMAEFERRLREHVDKRIAGDAGAKADFSKVDATKLTLIDTSAMDESVITGNIKRNVENFCHDELLTLNRGMGTCSAGPTSRPRQSARARRSSSTHSRQRCAACRAKSASSSRSCGS